MKTLTDYQIILRPDDNGTFVAYVPVIEGCHHAWGKTFQEARSELNYVFEMVREEYLESGQPLPDDVVEITISHAS